MTRNTVPLAPPAFPLVYDRDPASPETPSDQFFNDFHAVFGDKSSPRRYGGPPNSWGDLELVGSTGFIRVEFIYRLPRLVKYFK